MITDFDTMKYNEQLLVISIKFCHAWQKINGTEKKAKKKGKIVVLYCIKKNCKYLLGLYESIDLTLGVVCEQLQLNSCLGLHYNIRLHRLNRCSLTVKM